MLDPPEHLVAHVWNITNLDDFINGRSKPIIEEVGPYAFRYYVYKYNVSFGDQAHRGWCDFVVVFVFCRCSLLIEYNRSSGDVAYFRRHREFFYDPTYPNTRDPYADVVATLNVVYAAAVVGGNITEEPVRNPLPNNPDVGLRYFFGEEPASPMVNVVELLFGGPYPYYINLTLEQFLNENSPLNEGYRAFRTGRDSVDATNQFVLWDDVKDIRDTWDDDWVEYIYGSDGTIFHRDVQHTDVVYAWVCTHPHERQAGHNTHAAGNGKEPDIYRIVPMTNEGHREVDVQGITTYRFVTEVSFRHTLLFVLPVGLLMNCWLSLDSTSTATTTRATASTSCSARMAS